MEAGSTAYAAGTPRPIVAEVNLDWTHAQSGVVLPATIADFTRGGNTENIAEQLDVVASYDDPKTGSTLTIFLFRAGLPQAPLWLDRIDAAIQVSAKTSRLGGGVLDAKPDIVAFAPTGEGQATALRLVYGMTGGTSKATGAAAIPVNDWLLTIRLTSKRLEKGMLASTLAQIASGLALPKIKQPLPVAVPVTPCSDPIVFKPAKRAKADMTDALFAGLLGSMASDDLKTANQDDTATKAPSPPAGAQTFCRDASSTSDYGIYRNDNGMNGYIMALGDAGVLIDVSPSLSGLLTGKNKAKFYVRLRMLDRDYNFAPFNSLPTPQQVMQVLSSENPISSSDRSGNISITG